MIYDDPEAYSIRGPLVSFAPLQSSALTLATCSTSMPPLSRSAGLIRRAIPPFIEVDFCRRAANEGLAEELDDASA